MGSAGIELSPQTCALTQTRLIRHSRSKDIMVVPIPAARNMATAPLPALVPHHHWSPFPVSSQPTAKQVGSVSPAHKPRTSEPLRGSRCSRQQRWLARASTPSVPHPRCPPRRHRAPASPSRHQCALMLLFAVHSQLRHAPNPPHNRSIPQLQLPAVAMHPTSRAMHAQGDRRRRGPQLAAHSTPRWPPSPSLSHSLYLAGADLVLARSLTPPAGCSALSSNHHRRRRRHRISIVLPLLLYPVYTSAPLLLAARPSPPCTSASTAPHPHLPLAPPHAAAPPPLVASRGPRRPSSAAHAVVLRCSCAAPCPCPCAGAAYLAYMASSACSTSAVEGRAEGSAFQQRTARDQ